MWHDLRQRQGSKRSFLIYTLLCVCVSCSVVSTSLRPMDCSPPGLRLLCPWNLPVKNTSVSCHSLLQGIFRTQGLNPGLPHCRQILYHLSHQGSPYTLLLSSIMPLSHSHHCHFLSHPITGIFLILLFSSLLEFDFSEANCLILEYFLNDGDFPPTSSCYNHFFSN